MELNNQYIKHQYVNTVAGGWKQTAVVYCSAVSYCVTDSMSTLHVRRSVDVEYFCTATHCTLSDYLFKTSISRLLVRLPFFDRLIPLTLPLFSLTASEHIFW